MVLLIRYYKRDDGFASFSQHQFGKTIMKNDKTLAEVMGKMLAYLKEKKLI